MAHKPRDNNQFTAAVAHIRIRMFTVDFFLGSMQMLVKPLGFSSRQRARQFLSAQFPKPRHAPETFEQLSRRLFADSRDGGERSLDAAFGPALPVESHGEAMSLVSNLLDQVQDRRTVVQSNRFVFSPVNVQNLFLLRDARERLINHLERLQSFRSRVQLPDASVDEHKAGHRFLVGKNPSVPPGNHFAHACKIVAHQFGRHGIAGCVW